MNFLTQWQFCLQAWERNKFPQALILHGMITDELKQFADHLAQFLLCEQKSDQRFCDQCSSCRWFQQKHHPDYLNIVSDKQIKIDDIRELQQQLHQTHVRQSRIVVIDALEKMNLAASNAFLKVLEEPSIGVYFLLLSQQLKSLPATIRSRCTVLSFKQDELTSEQQKLRQTLMQKLDELSAKKANLITLSQWCLKQDSVKLILQWLIEWTQQQILRQPQQAVSWFGYYDAIMETEQLLQQKINLNQELLFEQLFARIVLNH